MLPKTLACGVVTTLSFFLLSIAVAASSDAKLFKPRNNEVPQRSEGQGSYERLVVRGGYIIDGTGATP